MSALCLPHAFSMTRAFEGPKSKVQCVKALLPRRLLHPAAPEFVEDCSAWMMSKRLESAGADRRATVRAGMAQPHDGQDDARFMQAVVERTGAAFSRPAPAAVPATS
jgi:hypothetical protein